MFGPTPAGSAQRRCRVAAIRVTACAVFALSLTIGLTGCGTFSDVIARPVADAKVLDGRLAALSVDEILALNHAVIAALPEQPVPFLSRLMAEELHGFFQLNHLNTLADAEAFAAAAAANPASIPGLPELAAAFQGTAEEFDPGAPTVLDIEEILETVFGGGVAPTLPQIFQGDGIF